MKAGKNHASFQVVKPKSKSKCLRLFKNWQMGQSLLLNQTGWLKNISVTYTVINTVVDDIVCFGVSFNIVMEFNVSRAPPRSTNKAAHLASKPR